MLLSISTGIRVGAWDYMKWKHITPIKDENGTILAAKLVVYPNEPEEYFTFMTPESYNAVKEWMDFRVSFGEEITGEGWILRNTWQKVKPRYSHRIGLAKYPRQFKSTGIKTLEIIATVHSTGTVSIVIGCSYCPVALDVDGVVRLSNALATVKERISNLTNGGRNTLSIPDHMSWIVTM